MRVFYIQNDLNLNLYQKRFWQGADGVGELPTQKLQVVQANYSAKGMLAKWTGRVINRRSSGKAVIFHKMERHLHHFPSGLINKINIAYVNIAKIHLLCSSSHSDK